VLGVGGPSAPPGRPISRRQSESTIFTGGRERCPTRSRPARVPRSGAPWPSRRRQVGR
jgi:hypothetical protein